MKMLCMLFGCLVHNGCCHSIEISSRLDYDFDKLKAFFRSRIHITMIILLFAVNRQQWANKNLFPFPNGRKKKTQIEKTSSKNMSQIT